MRQKSKTLLFRSYTILLCLSIAAAGICLMAQCLLIYQSGERPFSREAVAAAFSQIALPVYLCGTLVLLGLLLKPLFPAAKSKHQVSKNYDLILHRLQSTTELSLCPAPLRSEVASLQTRRVLVRNLGWVLLAVGSVVFLCYGANPGNYDANINQSMVKAMIWLIPTMAAPFAYSIFVAYYRQRSITKEITLLKSAPKEAKCPNIQKAPAANTESWLRWVVLAAALLLIGYGYLVGGAVDVLTKAVNICTECIGLG